MDCVLYNKEPLTIVNNMDMYFKNVPPDCKLLSEDKSEILFHKELLFQTKFTRELLLSVGNETKIEVICPSLLREELEIIVYFLYNGRILSSDKSGIFKASKILEELFGFPLIQDEVFDTKETIILPNKNFGSNRNDFPKAVLGAMISKQKSKEI